MASDLPPLRTDAYIDGAWRGAPGRFAVHDPATGKELARVADLDDGAVDDAIAAAARALPAWRARSAYDRAGCLARLAAAMRAGERELAAIITAENGKPTSESIAEVRYAASFLEWFAGEAVRVYGETIPATRPDQRITVTREPVGVCALVTPWNFPAAMLTRKLGPALAVGCTVVCKPASETPLTVLALAAMGEAAGLPAGVLNIVTGDARRIGARLTASPAVRKLSFTGSTTVGRLLAAQCAPDLKRLSLELGGNAPFLVFEDADLERAVTGAMVAKFRNTGQSCVAANRFLVHGSIAPRFVEAIVARVRALKVGPGAEPGVDIGPLIHARAGESVRRRIRDAIDGGARAECGGAGGEGVWVQPTVLTGVTPEMAVWREEVFGPVVSVTTFSDEAEAIALANATEAGLVAYVYTRDATRQLRIASALEAGMIGVNEGLVSTAQAPFGGIKQSGYGREGSRHGLDEYTQYKYVMTAL
jgi:succinate-semialdehyde dehydrogenase / glutarate-semialdehyde dehydrogenase